MKYSMKMTGGAHIDDINYGPRFIEEMKKVDSIGDFYATIAGWQRSGAQIAPSSEDTERVLIRFKSGEVVIKMAGGFIHAAFKDVAIPSVWHHVNFFLSGRIECYTLDSDKEDAITSVASRMSSDGWHIASLA